VRLRTAHRHRHARRSYASRNGAVRKVHFKPHRYRYAGRYPASWNGGFFFPGILFRLFF